MKAEQDEDCARVKLELDAAKGDEELKPVQQLVHSARKKRFRTEQTCSRRWKLNLDAGRLRRSKDEPVLVEGDAIIAHFCQYYAWGDWKGSQIGTRPGIARLTSWGP